VEEDEQLSPAAAAGRHEQDAVQLAAEQLALNGERHDAHRPGGIACGRRCERRDERCE
jgi:hypothetical protein